MMSEPTDWLYFKNITSIWYLQILSHPGTIEQSELLLETLGLNDSLGRVETGKSSVTLFIS